MSKAKTEELKKHTLNLRDGDMEQLAILFPKHSPSVMARKIISKFIDRTMVEMEGNEDLNKVLDSELPE